MRLPRICKDFRQVLRIEFDFDMKRRCGKKELDSLLAVVALFGLLLFGSLLSPGTRPDQRRERWTSLKLGQLMKIFGFI